MTEIVLNKKVARKVLATVDAGLVYGMGKPVPGQMCVEAAVNYALGLPHGDNPSCVGAAVRSFKISLNDANWPTNESRTKGMRKLAIAQLGSDKIDQKAFRIYVCVETVKQILPITLRAAGSMIPAHKEALEAAAVVCEAAVDLSSALAASRAARVKALSAKSAADAAADAAAYAAAAAAAVYADAYAAYAADADAAYAADAAVYADAYAAYAADAAADAAAAAVYAADADAAYAADAAVYADAYAAYAADAAADAAAAAVYAAAKAKARIKVLSLAAKIGLDALIKLKSPGVKWLDLCE